MRTYTIILLFLIFGIICNSKSVAQSFQYYPLSVGDYWEYIDPLYPEVLTIEIVKNSRSIKYDNLTFRT